MSILETSGPFYPGYGLRRGHVEGVLLGLVLFFVLMREPPVAGGGGPAGLAAFYPQLRAVPLGRGWGNASLESPGVSVCCFQSGSFDFVLVPVSAPEMLTFTLREPSYAIRNCFSSKKRTFRSLV